MTIAFDLWSQPVVVFRAGVTIFPETVSGKEKAGALLPSGIMVEGVSGMKKFFTKVINFGFSPFGY
jgi:hypothetical protein